jgi:hypothetical protein
MMTIINKNKKWLIAVVVGVVSVFISWQMPVILSLYNFAIKRIEYSGHIKINNLQIQLPEKWWVERKDSRGFILSRIPSLGDEGYLLVSIYVEDGAKLCERVQSGGWIGGKCNEQMIGPLYFYKDNESKEKNHYDVLWVYPSNSVGVISTNKNKAEIAQIDVLIDGMTKNN